MHTLKHSALALAALAVLLGAAAFVTPLPGLGGVSALAAPPPTPNPTPTPSVKVVNGPDQPVPVTGVVTGTVTGAVSITNTPNVNVTNTPNVNVVGTPTVQIGNTSANPLPVRDADNPARQPFTEFLNTTDKTSITVPAGKRLVIEYVSAKGLISTGEKFLTVALRCNITFSGGSAFVSHYFTPHLMGTLNGGFDIYSVSQQTRLYCEPGGPVEVFLEKTGGFGGLNYTVSGYLVDVP